MRNDYIVRKTYQSFVVSSILGSLTATVGILIDNIIVGRALGAEALGAMGIVGPISLIFSAVGNISSTGGGTRAAQALGRGQQERCSMIFTTNILFVLVISTLLMVAGLIFTPQIAMALGAKDVLLEPTRQYLYGYFLGTVPIILLSAMMSFIRIDGSPKLPLICISVMSAANIALDFAMIYVFQLGMFGMALATSISYWLAVGTACTHFLKKGSKLRFVMPERFFCEFQKIVFTGFPTAVSRISDTFKVMLMNNMLTAFVSISAVTALNVRTQANNFLGAVVLGFGQAATPMIGMFFGEGDKTAAKDTLKTTLRYGLKTIFVIAVVLLVFPAFFSSLMGLEDGEIKEMADQAIRIFAIGMPLYLINMVLMNFYQSTKRIGMATMICIMQSLVYTVSAAFVLIRPLGAFGAWLAFLLGEMLTLVTVLIVICVKNKNAALSLDAVMMLDAGFSEADEKRLEISIGNSMDEVMKISSGIGEFWEGRENDERMLNVLSLSIEEMAGNVVKHAFKPGEKRWLDLIIIDRPSSVIIRIRDNGAPFDPLAYLNCNARDKYGIKMTRALSEDFEYRRCLGLNNLIIHLKKENNRLNIRDL